MDQTRAIVGGRNIADEYFDMGESYNFLDRDIYVEGEIVQNTAQSFQKLWSSYPTDVVERPPIPKKSDLRYQRAGRSQAHRKYSDWIRDRRHWKLQVKNARRFAKLIQIILDCAKESPSWRN